MIAAGSLSSDDLAKTLVPLLLKKADKIRRGCVQRTGGQVSTTCSSGLLQLGVMMGGCLNSSEVQKSFGISSQCALDNRCPLTSPLLPRFFCAEHQDLVEGIGLTKTLLEGDGQQRDYMLVRDEVVYARTFSTIYGLCFLSCVVLFCL